MTSGSIRQRLAIFVTALDLMLSFGCAGDAEEDTIASSSKASASPTRGLEPSAELLAEIVMGLPVFPASDANHTGYSIAGILAGHSTGFNVTLGTSVDDIEAFFSEELPADGWQEEVALHTVSAKKAGTVSKDVIWSWVKDGIRLAITIPLTHKDAPDRVTAVTLLLTAESSDFLGTSPSTPIDSTPPPTQLVPTTTMTFAPSTSPAPASPDPTSN